MTSKKPGMSAKALSAMLCWCTVIYLVVFGVVMIAKAAAHEEVPQLNSVGAEALRFCESSHNYQSEHLDRYTINGVEHQQWVYGAYQFTQPTWDWTARQIGFFDVVGIPPSKVDIWTQNYMAVWLWNHDPGGRHHRHWATKCWQAAVDAMIETPNKNVAPVPEIPTWGSAPVKAPVPTFTG